MKRFTEAQFKEIYSQVPRLTVEALVWTSQGVPLVLRKHHTWNNLWHIPGGTVYYQESLQDALKRVAVHELGIEIIPGSLLQYLQYPTEEDERGYGWTIGLLFECETKDTIPPCNQDGEEIQCFSSLPDNLVKEQRVPLDAFIAHRI